MGMMTVKNTQLVGRRDAATGAWSEQVEPASCDECGRRDPPTGGVVVFAAWGDGQNKHGVCADCLRDALKMLGVG